MRKYRKTLFITNRIIVYNCYINLILHFIKYFDKFRQCFILYDIIRLIYKGVWYG